jgi:hypothetical protein
MSASPDRAAPDLCPDGCPGHQLGRDRRSQSTAIGASQTVTPDSSALAAIQIAPVVLE